MFQPFVLLGQLIQFTVSDFLLLEIGHYGYNNINSVV